MHQVYSSPHVWFVSGSSSQPNVRVACKSLILGAYYNTKHGKDQSTHSLLCVKKQKTKNKNEHFSSQQIGGLC
jgi:hypothetical protein